MGEGRTRQFWFNSYVSEILTSICLEFEKNLLAQKHAFLAGRLACRESTRCCVASASFPGWGVLCLYLCQFPLWNTASVSAAGTEGYTQLSLAETRTANTPWWLVWCHGSDLRLAFPTCLPPPQGSGSVSVWGAELPRECTQEPLISTHMPTNSLTTKAKSRVSYTRSSSGKLTIKTRTTDS